MNKKNLNDVILVVETVLLFGLIYFLIMSNFFKELYFISLVLSSLLLFVFAFNEISVKKRKKQGIIYLICGIIILVMVVI